MKFKYKTVFISDLHLGSSSAQAEPLAKLLKHIRCEQLYLVGDIIDGWRLKNRFHWPDAHNQVLRRLLKAAHNGCDVVFIPGNHDEVMRQFIGLTFGGVRILPYDEIELQDGRKFFVTHGDQFDLVVQHSRLLSKLGGTCYDWLVKMNSPYNRVRSILGMKKKSLSQIIKLKVKKACTFISRFEEALADTARRRGMDGVICGHIQKAEMRDMDGILYANCGDWVESCTLLVEHHDGRFELLHGDMLLEMLEASKLKVPEETEKVGALNGHANDTVEEEFDLPVIPREPAAFFEYFEKTGFPGLPQTGSSAS